MVDWRMAKVFCAMASVVWLRETVMSTMEPEDMSGGRRMEGNSIFGRGVSLEGLRSYECATRAIVGRTYYSFVLGKEDSHAGVDFADRQ
jgi:hypothetical protein